MIQSEKVKVTLLTKHRHECAIIYNNILFKLGCLYDVLCILTKR